VEELKGIRELIHIMLVNPTARSVIMGNIRNPAALNVVKEGLNPIK